MSTSDLREAMGLDPDPEFELQLPPGWTRQEVGGQAMESMLSAMRRRFMEQHRPDLYAEMRTMVKKSFEDMERNGVFAFFSPTEEGDQTLAIPASIHASVRRSAPGATLDDLARTLIQQRGATPLLGDTRTLRFEEERNIKFGTETIVAQSVIYMTPIPGARRRRALQLVAGFGRTMDTPADHERIEAMKFLFDRCVATLSWRPAV